MQSPNPPKTVPAGRALAYFCLRYILRRRFLRVRAQPFDLQIKACTSDAAARHIFKRGTYEPELTAFLLDQVYLSPGDTALDIGANLGWYSLLLAKRFPTARIIAFEPEPMNFQLLSDNLSANGCANVRPEQFAVAEREGELELYPYAAKNRGRHSLLKINDGTPIKIRTVSLDGYLAGANVAPQSVRFLKIDIEGYEYHALSGGRHTLASVPCILSEFSPEYMRRGGIEPRLYVDLLVQTGFVPHRWSEGRLEPVSPADLLARDVQTDVIWKKNSSAGGR
jgi:FkbM family methyltransferase